MEFEHAVRAWTVGELREALEGLPDDLPIIVDVAEEPGGDTVQEQVVIEAGFGHGVDGRGEPFVGRELRIACEFPSGTYLRRDR
ncbi:hypothetical protein ASG92_20680 [Arthrobacter sp. Soil736]|uniref:DUF6225 family protein n=1 Tax=Arthrobacter sp. Soil736 TaxID=1736395 RepID=UPI0006FA31D8|nr:DUF6225 family protein [Arthrobacter sp. Soil736]KRE61797.1 hypothetical protein ASG92_20680 [Arthrobacter sp. Soil736]